MLTHSAARLVKRESIHRITTPVLLNIWGAVYGAGNLHVLTVARVHKTPDEMELL